MNQCHILYRATGYFGAAGYTGLFGNEVGPTRTVGEVSAALAGSPDGEGGWSAGAVLRSNQAGGQKGVTEIVAKAKVRSLCML